MSGPAPDLRAPRPGLLQTGLRAVAGNSKVRKAAMSTPFVRDLAWRFVAGEDLEAGLATVRRLNEQGIDGTLNLVGTHTRSRDEAVAAAEAVIAAVEGIAAAAVRSHVSLKLTLIGLDVDEALCRELMHRILDRAAGAGVFVRIDMEESRYVERTLALFEDARDRYGADRVGIVLQSYLRLRRDDVAKQASAGSSVRLVRGGYWESPEVVYASKAEVDAAFHGDIDVLIRDGVRPAIATHDERAIEAAQRAVAAYRRDPGDIEFQMLLGVRADLAEGLVAEGWRVRCYVPYGGQWYAYALGCIRRLPATTLAELKTRARGGGSRSARTDARAAPVGRRGPDRMALPVVKRLFDIAGALAGLMLLGPLMAWTAVGVALTMGFPVLFRQQRPGKDAGLFTVIKFRTMRAPRRDERWYATDADRVTGFGRFLRSSSLDELPELWNVLRGEMSLVGPRPLLVEYLPHYTERERLRHAMRPGITGWAAVMGRHTLGFEERLELDAWYVEHWSLALDLRILAMTIRQVLGRESVRDTQDFEDIAFPDRFLAGLESSAGDVAAAPPGRSAD